MARDSLAELLRRCHREELARLALRVGVRHEGIGQASLSRALAGALRAAGGNRIANLVLRRGAGPSWPDVVAGVLSRLGLETCGDVRADEVAVLRHAVARRLDGLDPDSRAAALAELGLPEPPPTSGIDSLWPEIGPGTALRLAPFVFLSALPPLSGAWLLWLATEPRDRTLIPAIAEVARLRDAVAHRLTVGVVGSPSTGKDAAVRALFGVDTGNVSPVAGSTKTVEIKRLPDAPALYVVNTPGMGDVLEHVTEEARQILDHIDVFLYLVNAQGGAQQRERADFALIRRTGRPVAVLINKIDTLRPDDRERFVARTQAQIGAGAAPVLPVAFDPLPQLAPAPMGVDVVRRWLADAVLTLGKTPAALGPYGPPPGG